MKEGLLGKFISRDIVENMIFLFFRYRVERYVWVEYSWRDVEFSFWY